MSEPFPRNQTVTIGDSEMDTVPDAATALKDKQNMLPTNGFLGKEEKNIHVRALDDAAVKSLVKQNADNSSDDTWEKLLSSDEDKLRLYLEGRLSELRIRKQDNDKAVFRMQTMMNNSLMKDIRDFRHRVLNENRVGSLRDYFVEQSALFERYLQQSMHKSPQEPAVKKPKISNSRENRTDFNKYSDVNSHEIPFPQRDANTCQTKGSNDTDQDFDSQNTKACGNTGQLVDTRPLQASSRALVKPLEAFKHVKEIRETSTGDKGHSSIRGQDLPATAAEELEYSRSFSNFITDEGVLGSNAGCSENLANIIQREVMKNPATNFQEEVMKDPATNFQEEVMKGPATNFQEEVMKGPATNFQEEVMKGPATNFQEEVMKGPATNFQEEVLKGPSTNFQEEVINDPATNFQGEVVKGPATNFQGEVIKGPATNFQGEVIKGPFSQTQGEIWDSSTKTHEEIIKYSASNIPKEIIQHPATKIQREIIKDPATNTLGEVTTHPAINSQDAVVRDPGINIQEVIRAQATKDQEDASISQEISSISQEISIINGHQTTSRALESNVPGSNKAENERVETLGIGAARMADATTSTDDGFFHTRNKAHPTPAEPDTINLLLIGTCGNGKSATGNSILGAPVFQRSASSSVSVASSTSSIRIGSTNISGQVVNVVDGPSINVSGKITAEELEKVTESINQALELCKWAFDALVIVLKFGGRFTKQEMESLRVIKAVLGKDVIREFGVCVITFGDSFDYAVDDAREDGEELTFDSWLKDQKGEVTKLLEECGFRCVLFDNVTKDDKKRQNQIDRLMQILPQGKRYSEEEFFKAWEGIHNLEMEANLPKLLKEAQAEADKIRELLEHAENTKKQDPEAIMVSSKLSELKAKVYKVNAKSGELESLKVSLQLLEAQLKSKTSRWRFERNKEMNAGVPDNALALSWTTPPQAQQRPAIRERSSNGFGMHLDTENSQRAGSRSETSYMGSQAMSYSGLQQCSSNMATAARYRQNTEARGQGPNFTENIHSFEVMGGSLDVGRSNLSIAEIIKKRVIAFVNGLTS